MILVLIYYVFAVMASKILGVAFPEWFGSIGASFSTFFSADDAGELVHICPLSALDPATKKLAMQVKTWQSSST